MTAASPHRAGRHRRGGAGPARPGAARLGPAVIGTVVVAGVAGAWIGSRSAGAGGTVLTGYGVSSGSARLSHGSGGLHDAAGGAGTAFVIAGSVDGLYPGATLPLELRIVDRLRSPITVTSITTSVGSASRRCSASLVNVSDFSGHLVVQPGRPAVAVVHVTMQHGTPDACQGTAFPLVYSGRGKAS
jgi:hypothetical protein